MSDPVAAISPAVAVPAAAPAQAAGSSADPGRAFEAFVLGSVVETMLPRSDSAFGSGTAGSMWRAQMAEMLGRQIVEAGGIGLAAILEPTDSARDTKAAPSLEAAR